MVYVFIIPESYTITFYINGGFLLILVKTKKAKYRTLKTIFQSGISLENKKYFRRKNAVVNLFTTLFKPCNHIF